MWLTLPENKVYGHGEQAGHNEAEHDTQLVSERGHRGIWRKFDVSFPCHCVFLLFFAFFFPLPFQFLSSPASPLVKGSATVLFDVNPQNKT